MALAELLSYTIHKYHKNCKDAGTTIYRVGHKNRSILKCVTRVTQKNNTYIKLFNTLYEVRLVSRILLQLSILCTGLVK